MEKAFDELNILVQRIYDREKGAGGIIPPGTKSSVGPTLASSYHGKSIQDLSEEECRLYASKNDIPSSSIHSSSTRSPKQKEQKLAEHQEERCRIQIVEGWKQLMDILVEKQIFMDQAQTLRKGFMASMAVAGVNGPKGPYPPIVVDDEEDGGGGGSIVTHFATLIRLLVHTAWNVDRDDSTECRFATLLEILLSYIPQWEASEEVSRLWIRLMQRIPYQCAPMNFRRKAYRILVSLSWVPSSKGLLAACSIPERSTRVTPLPKASQTYRSALSYSSSSSSKRRNSNRSNNGGSGSSSDDANPVVMIPRHDSVNQLLDRLKDETDVCVAITSYQPGIGKSTLASLVVSHPSIQKSFFVVWIRLLNNNNNNNRNESNNNNNKPGHHNMSFETYRNYIIQIRDQIREQQRREQKNLDYDEEDDETIQFTFPTCEERFEEPAVRRLREEQAMQETKERVSKVLSALPNPNLLLVLENVVCDAQIPLFRFHEKQSMIVTTTSVQEELSNVDWQVELDPISCEEAVDLFLGHAGFHPSHPVGQTPELQRLLANACRFLPLAIRTVGRWCRLKAVSAGPIRACMEVIEEVEELLAAEEEEDEEDNHHPAMDDAASACGSRRSATGTADGSRSAPPPPPPSDSPMKRFLFDVLSLMIGPAQKKLFGRQSHDDDTGGSTSAVFVVCLAAMAVVFPSGQRVPLDVVLLLWEQLILVEPVVANEAAALLDSRRNSTSTLGSSKNGKYSTSKEERAERRQFVGMIAQGLLHMGVIEIYEVDSNTWVEIHHDMYIQFALTMAHGLDLGESTFDYTVQKWHKAFVTSYFEQRIQKNISIEAVGGRNSLNYAVRFLPTHIFHANMMKMGETMLVDARFFETRVNALGWEKAVAIHIQDCLTLQSGYLDYHAHHTSKSTLSSTTSTITSSSSSSSTGPNMLDMLIVSPVFAKSSAMISSFEAKSQDENGYNSDDENRVTSADVSKALYRMAFALAGHGYFEESLAQFNAAQKFVPEMGELESSILYGIAWVLLVSGDSKRALRKISSALKTMKEMKRPHVLYKEARQLHIDVLYERCEYRKALNFLGEIEAELLRDKDNNVIELGAVLRKKGGLLQVMGRTKEAAEALQKAIEWKEKAEECSYGLASCYCQLGDVNMELHALSGTRDYFDHAVTTLLAAQCDKEHVSYLVATGKLYFSNNDFNRCFEALESARNAIRVAPLYLMDQSAYDLRCIARAYRARKEIQKAIDAFRESLALTAHRPNSLERACCLRELAQCLLEGQKNDDEGLTCLQEALNITMIGIGHCIQVFDLMNTIGLVHKIRGEYDDALKVFSKAGNMLESVAPDDTEKEANVYFSVGEVEEERGNIQAALGAYTQATTILKGTHASDDPSFAKAYQYTARVLGVCNRLDEARQKLEDAVLIRSQRFDERALAECKFALGVVLRKLGVLDQAEKNLKEALAIRERNSGSHEHVETLFELGNIHLLTQPAEAFVFYEDCIKKIDSKNALAGDVYQAMGHVKFFEMKEDDALLFYKRARDIRQTYHGKYHRKTANAIRGIGLTQLFFRRKEEAEKSLELLSKTCENIVTNMANRSSYYGMEKKVAATRDYILAVIFLGDAYFANKRRQEAAEFWNKAAEIFEQALSDNLDIPPALRDIYKHRIAAMNQGSNVSADHTEAQALASMIYVDD